MGFCYWPESMPSREYRGPAKAKPLAVAFGNLGRQLCGRETIWLGNSGWLCNCCIPPQRRSFPFRVYFLSSEPRPPWRCYQIWTLQLVAHAQWRQGWQWHVECDLLPRSEGQSSYCKNQIDYCFHLLPRLLLLYRDDHKEAPLIRRYAGGNQSLLRRRMVHGPSIMCTEIFHRIKRETSLLRSCLCSQDKSLSGIRLRWARPAPGSTH